MNIQMGSGKLSLVNNLRQQRAEIFTAQALTDTSIYYFHVAADRAEDVLKHLAERSEFQAIKGVKRVDVYEGELFARFDGQLPVHHFSFD
jgi:hypothetical protein